MLRTLKKRIKSIFSKELQILRRWDYVCYYLLYRMQYRIIPNQILMLSESREKLSGNLKFIDDEIDKTRFSVIYSLRKIINLKN